MRLLKILRTADERADDLLSDESGFSDDLKELAENVSLDVLEDIVKSPLGNLLLPETVERLREKKEVVKLGTKPELELEPEQIFPDAHSAQGDLSILDNARRLEEKAQEERVKERRRAFWRNSRMAATSRLGRLSSSPPSSPTTISVESKLEPEPKPEPKPPPESEFHDAYSALRAAEKIVNNIHIRLLARGEGSTEEGVIKLIAEAMRIIGCVREMDANADADGIEQKLDRILKKFSGTIP